jgi:hypothetical protein
MRTISRFPTALALTALAACASAPSIQPANSSRSAFEGTAYAGATATVNSATPGNTEFRVFRQGGTGFVPIQSVRTDAEQGASEYCERKGKVMNPLRETVAKPPYLLGNLPRIEIVFECVEKPQVASMAMPEDAKYAKLVTLKKLLDSGALTQEEFEREKGKFLRQP